jgi:pimeloyl-ACP methyl ester carboxylesterase
MNAVRKYPGLPFTWEGKAPEIIQNDRRWLESIVRNAAPFSDWWTKTRIVQLAYPLPPNTEPQQLYGLPAYGGLTSEAAIADALRQSCDLTQNPEFAQKVNEDYVIETLSCWRRQQFTQAISRNFDVYAHREQSNVFLVVSTTPVSLEVDRVLPPVARFRPLFNVDELAKIVCDRKIQRLTLRTHGYSNPAKSFYQSFNNEANALNQPQPITKARTLQDDHLYIGYHWPSEQPIFSAGLWLDYRHNLGILLKFLVVLGSLSGVVGLILYGLLRLITAVQWYWIIPTTFVLWLLVFLLLRIVVYQRDRYRAVHYGAPDLAEFFWRLDQALVDLAGQPAPPDSSKQPQQMMVNLVGHSMGGLLLVNLLRILSERGRDEQGTLKPDSELSPGNDPIDEIGRYLVLDKLILASPDIPLEFLREGRNNYVRSAMRRCRRIYLMSSDRDIVLRYLSTIGNWFTEPSMQMAGERLGNIYLKQMPAGSNSSFLPYIRIMVHSERAVQPTSSYELFRKFNYLDCSEMRGAKGGGVNAVALKLNHLTALPIDLANTLIYFVGANNLDVHGGYFQTNTRSFQIFKFLLTANLLDDDAIQAEIEEMIQSTPIRFLPSQPWKMPQTADGTRSVS